MLRKHRKLKSKAIRQPAARPVKKKRGADSVAVSDDDLVNVEVEDDEEFTVTTDSPELAVYDDFESLEDVVFRIGRYSDGLSSTDDANDPAIAIQELARSIVCLAEKVSDVMRLQMSMKSTRSPRYKKGGRN
jgi:hypothetical protein